MRNIRSKHPLKRTDLYAVSLRTSFISAALLMSTHTGTVVAEDTLFFAEPEICPKDVIDIPQILLDAYGSDTSSQEIVLESDQIESPDGNSLMLTGNAQVIQGSQAIFGQSITYDKESFSLNAEDDVTLITPTGDKLSMDRLNLEMETMIGDADSVSFQLAERESTNKKRNLHDSGGFRFGTENDGLKASIFADIETDKEEEETKIGIAEVRADMRGEAKTLFFEGQTRQRLKDVALTSCPAGNDAVFLKASEIVLDHETGVGIGTNMSVRFFGVPVFYFPKASFPINDERKTGFLFPSIGSQDTNGTIIEIPYYVNIAPNKDASINLKYMSERGVQLRGEYRYLGENYDGILRGAFLPDDELFGDDRSAWSYIHNHRISDNWQTDVKIQDVSDVDYTDDFSNNVNVSGSSFLDQQAQLRYRKDRIKFDAKVRDYTVADSSVNTNNEPYALLPRLSFSAETPSDFAGGNITLGVDSEFTSFDHDGDRVAGTRTVLTPYIEAPLTNVYGYITPRLSVVNNSYSLDNVGLGDDDGPSVSVPIFSLDAGIAFERDVTWNGTAHHQTLEPRIYYVYASDENQDDIPLFDTGGGDANNIGNFYRDNHFYGSDRVGDANRLTVGLTSRIIDSDTGEERLKAEIGQMFHFDDRNVLLNPGDEIQTESKSDFIADVRGHVNPRWEIGGTMRYDHEESEAAAFRLDTSYEKDPRRKFSLYYTWDNTDFEQVDIEADFPLAKKWQFKVRERYDIEDGESRESLMQVTYDACCWAAQITAQDRTRRNSENDASVFFTLELKNLGKFSSAL